MCNRAQGFHLLSCESWREKKLLFGGLRIRMWMARFGIGDGSCSGISEKPIPVSSGRRFWDSSRVFFFGQVRLLSQRLVSTERAETVYEKK